MLFRKASLTVRLPSEAKKSFPTDLSCGRRPNSFPCGQSQGLTLRASPFQESSFSYSCRFLPRVTSSKPLYLSSLACGSVESSRDLQPISKVAHLLLYRPLRYINGRRDFQLACSCRNHLSWYVIQVRCRRKRVEPVAKRLVCLGPGLVGVPDPASRLLILDRGHLAFICDQVRYRSH